jgi:hypothetical protein
LEVTHSPKAAVVGVGETVMERTGGGAVGARLTVAEFDPLVAAEAGTAINVTTNPNAPATTAATRDGRKRACSG